MMHHKAHFVIIRQIINFHICTRELNMAITVEEIEEAIIHLPHDQLKRFRAWYEKFDGNSWDTKIEKDMASGKLDDLANLALAEHHAGKSKKL